jgi:hypothetical protein
MYVFGRGITSVSTGNISVKVDTEALLNSQPLKTAQNIDL